MVTRTVHRVQVKSYQSDTLKGRRRAQLTIANRAKLPQNREASALLRELQSPVFRAASRSKKGHERTLVMFNDNAAVMMARRSHGQAFVTLTKIKSKKGWQRHTEQLPPAPLHRSINAAQNFLVSHGEAWSTAEQGLQFPSKRALQLLKYFDVAVPQICSSHTASALIHAHHFSRAFDSAFQMRPWVNGFDAAEVSFTELKNSQ